VIGAEDPLVNREQRGVLITGPGRIARLPGAVGQVAAERRTKGPEGSLTGAVSARDMQARLG